MATYVNLSGINALIFPAGITSTSIANGQTTINLTATGLTPDNTPSVTNMWFNSYNASTGTFGTAQPAFSNISGLGTAATKNFTGAGTDVPTGPTTSVSGDI